MTHLLKRLELNGFKSFAQKTVFEFPAGITAIVGPNGSGKSNIIDAIRWLLGERDAKSLRGGKGEDLIFAGTAKRPRVGLARASLSFDNKSKFFPIDFSEISVSREVRRDGANRYFLNSSEVRLKDLVDFFAKARLGTRGLVVITQGNSDIFINSSPIERREMVEEILGLREYQLKKAESERRLKNAQINLDKVMALTEEILPHLRSLKRQTSRWEKREILEKELADLENQLFGSEWCDIHDKISDIEKEIAGHKEEFKALEKEKKAAEENLKQVEANQPKERRELQEIRDKTQALLEKRSQIQKEIGRLEAKLEIGEDLSSSIDLSAPMLMDFMQKIREKLESLIHIDYEDFQSAIQEIIEEIDEILSGSGAKSHPTGVRESKINSELKKISEDLAELEKEIGELREKEKALEENQQQFLAVFKAAVAATEAAKDKIERWESKNQQRLFEKERFELRREEWERQVRQAGRRPEEFINTEIQKRAGQDELQGMERRAFKLRGDLASIGEIDEALVKEAKETEERYKFLGRELEDLKKAKDDLRKLITNLNERIRTEFGGALAKINEKFNEFFNLMFGGGHAKLKIAKGKLQMANSEEVVADAEKETKIADKEENNKEETEEEIEEGIEIDLKLPRKKLTSLGMLSGGERSLVGIAALFALISVSPPPFLVLDEIDAMLDERNARRFSEMLKEFSKKTQFIIVTHNRATMEAADILYGITLNNDETSKVVSLKLENG
jgi:chromosome segregation protein